MNSRNISEMLLLLWNIIARKKLRNLISAIQISIFLFSFLASKFLGLEYIFVFFLDKQRSQTTASSFHGECNQIFYLASRGFVVAITRLIYCFTKPFFQVIKHIHQKIHYHLCAYVDAHNLLRPL